MNIVEQANKRFKQILSEQDPATQMDELTKKMAGYDMTMKGKPFPTFLKPYLLDINEKPQFEKSTLMIMSAIERVVDAFFTDEKFKRLLELSGPVADFALINPIYPNRQIVTRLDAFYIPETKDIKYIEFNCDSPSGMGWHDVMVDMFWELESVASLHQEFTLQADKFLDTHAQMLLKKYRQFCENKGQKQSDEPLLAMVCARESTIRTDVEIIVEVLKSKGFRSCYADPRDFDYDGHTLTIKGEEVHLIYRDAVQEFLDEPYFGHTEAVLNAYKDENICFINPFSSRVGGLKSVLAVMHEERFHYLFTDEHLDAIQKNIPWTRLMRDIETVYQDQKVPLINFVKENKDLLVLKPSSGYGGIDVVIGPDMDTKEWQEKVDQAMAPGNNYVVQELVPIPHDDFPVMNEGVFEGFEPKKVNINFWAFDGVFGGAFARASTGSIINVHQGGGLVPVFYVGNQIGKA
ncbi:hypothetical protein ACFL27_00445 [candidate division CSSED10-310 bacterium]|uniref:Glutathionylspermidine synthase pre-ATP-grasp-like domain-containing protein n=1 Tax=candidate division CSSED10-310 bacterium TaxID=2855610 RepID=A0ABV6YR17_UNCC1